MRQRKKQTFSHIAAHGLHCNNIQNVILIVYRPGYKSFENAAYNIIRERILMCSTNLDLMQQPFVQKAPFSPRGLFDHKARNDLEALKVTSPHHFTDRSVGNNRGLLMCKSHVGMPERRVTATAAGSTSK